MTLGPCLALSLTVRFLGSVLDAMLFCYACYFLTVCGFMIFPCDIHLIRSFVVPKLVAYRLCLISNYFPTTIYGLDSSRWRGSPPGWGISSPLEDLISSTLVFSTFYLLSLLWVLYSVYFWISLARQYSANSALLGRPRVCFFLCRWRVIATTSQLTGGDWMEQDIFWEQQCHNKY